MIQRNRNALIALVFAVLLGTSGFARTSDAGLTELGTALAGPLAEQFGVPAASVTSLLESGISVDSVTQLLFVSESSGSDLDAVTDIYKETGNDITDTANKLKVDPSEYSTERVTAAINAAKEKAQADASEKAAKGASEAIGSAPRRVSLNAELPSANGPSVLQVPPLPQPPTPGRGNTVPPVNGW